MDKVNLILMAVDVVDLIVMDVDKVDLVVRSMDKAYLDHSHKDEIDLLVGFKVKSRY